MVECEFENTLRQRLNVVVLIDTWWNVNLLSRWGQTIIPQVLIDTWWNVNPIRLVTHCAAAFVLIDTWWNVNKSGKKLDYFLNMF